MNKNVTILLLSLFLIVSLFFNFLGKNYLNQSGVTENKNTKVLSQSGVTENKNDSKGENMISYKGKIQKDLPKEYYLSYLECSLLEKKIPNTDLICKPWRVENCNSWLGLMYSFYLNKIYNKYGKIENSTDKYKLIFKLYKEGKDYTAINPDNLNEEEFIKLIESFILGKNPTNFKATPLTSSKIWFENDENKAKKILDEFVKANADNSSRLSMYNNLFNFKFNKLNDCVIPDPDVSIFTDFVKDACTISKLSNLDNYCKEIKKAHLIY